MEGAPSVGSSIGAVQENEAESETELLARPHLEIYKQYIKSQWREYYFGYDALLNQLKCIPESDLSNDGIYTSFDKGFLTALRKVDLFVVRLIESIEQELTGIMKFWENTSAADKEKTLKNKSSRLNQNLERILKALNLKAYEAMAFFDFNNFSIRKLAFHLEMIKYDGLTFEHFESAQKRYEVQSDTQWTFFDSNLIVMSSQYYKNNWTKRREKLRAAQIECENLFTQIFRQKYTFLSDLELRFQKNTSASYKKLVSIGLKCGAIIAMSVTIFMLSFVFKSYDMFTNPALSVLSAVGSLLAFKLLWSCNIAIWQYYDVNYVTLLDFDNLHADYIATISESLSAMVVYFIIVIFYTMSLYKHSYFYESFLLYICPLLLIVLTFGFRSLQTWVLDIKSRSSDVISWKVLGNIFSTPFIPVTFRENYAGDCLTSFTGILVDSSFSTCYVLSGEFTRNPLKYKQDTLTSFGSSYLNCGSPTFLTFVGMLQLIPLFLRFLQCCRVMYDSNWTWWPQFFNALKYLTSMFVVLLQYLNPDFRVLVAYIVFVTLYKWWWDVTMDWGFGMFHYQTYIDLWTNYRSNKDDIHSYLLRKNRLFPQTGLYYVAIALNLVLRFLWVVSLVPAKLGINIVTKNLLIFLAALEIFRRCIWGNFRVEWEHLKFAAKGAPGFFMSNTLPSLNHIDSLEALADVMTEHDNNMVFGYSENKQ